MRIAAACALLVACPASACADGISAASPGGDDSAAIRAFAMDVALTG